MKIQLTLKLQKLQYSQKSHFKATSCSRLLGSGSLLFRKSVPTVGVLQSKSLTLSPALQKRVYGPAEVGLPSNTSHWKTERVVAAALLPVIPAALLCPTAAFDYTLSAVLIMHTHWGLHGVCTDYIHGDVLPKVLNVLVMALSSLALGGLFYLNYQDIGFGKAAQLIWKEL